MKKQINIEGMSCGHCVKHVEGALKDVAGIDTATVNLQGKYAIVHSKDDIDDSVLKEAIEK